MTKTQQARAVEILAEFANRAYPVPSGLTGNEAHRLAAEYGVSAPAAWEGNHGSIQVRRVDLAARIAKGGGR